MTHMPRMALAAVLGLSVLTIGPAGAMRQSEGGGEVAFKPSRSSTDVPAGRSTEIGFLAAFDKQACRRLRANVRVNQPRHGTVRTTGASASFTSGQVRTNKCAGRSIGGVKVIYTPDRGYRGADSFTINVSYRDGADRRVSTEGFHLNVR